MTDVIFRPHPPSAKVGNVRITPTVARSAGTVAAVGLASAGALHGVWAAGSTFPAASSDDLADLVVGRRPMPPPAACAAVTGLLAAATGLVVLTSRGRGGRLAARGTSAVATTLAVRGAGGLAIGAAGLGQATETFRRWDRRLYSPLCLALAAAAALARPR